MPDSRLSHNPEPEPWHCRCLDPFTHDEDGPERRNPPNLKRCPDCGVANPKPIGVSV